MKDKKLFSKVIVSGIIDFLLFVLLAWSFNKLVFISPLSANYKAYYQEVITIQDTYKLDTGFGEKTYISPANETTYANFKLYEDEVGLYVVTDISNIADEVNDAYAELLAHDENYQNHLDRYRMASLLLLCLVVGTTELIIFVLVPLTNNNRATSGKLLLKLKTVSSVSGQTAEPLHIFTQFFILFLVFSILPYMVLGEFMLIFVPLLLMTFSLFDKEHRAIHQRLVNLKSVNINDNVVVEGEKVLTI